ncbi:chaperone required for assembly of F1-ATPase [Sphingomonas sp. SORGH_AS870]|uniref:ATP12 family chaperone protein n=1 Tax=unclassified Sphingomonas TaxID=196159 RepID=UPI002855C49C|nr:MULTISPECIES: ATP12 family protein [unclassified Sphingomonas]MDR6113541.1 chaperone required for assembly of F1-ATPase [Sphingomonas sp. SORGH_AS_0789]MDR6145350.1 chaperone required for assembly of F1-ATPase [Sphingomonas sp. SORGH_AS_0870]MDR6149098.1 chaperone required for assembly of F1-ATPase [Sphingomonas sp. SORGH_AS_0742]
MKRFWTNVGVDADRVVRLDDRPVRTPGRAPLALPTPALAEAVAGEWRAVEETVDPRAMPLTGLANAAIDRIGADPAPFAQGLARYAETDLLCYRADSPPELVERQDRVWNPLLDWARDRYDVHFTLVSGIMHRPQPDATVDRLAQAVAALDAFRLAALSPVVTITGSLVLALALLEGAAEPDAVWIAAHVDEDFQAEIWGEDYLAIEAREGKRREFDAAVRFLAALG